MIHEPEGDEMREEEMPRTWNEQRVREIVREEIRANAGELMMATRIAIRAEFGRREDRFTGLTQSESYELQRHDERLGKVAPIRCTHGTLDPAVPLGEGWKAPKPSPNSDLERAAEVAADAETIISGPGITEIGVMEIKGYRDGFLAAKTIIYRKIRALTPTPTGPDWRSIAEGLAGALCPSAALMESQIDGWVSRRMKALADYDAAVKEDEGK